MTTAVTRVFSVLGFPIVIMLSMVATILRTPIVAIPVLLIAVFYNFEHIAALFTVLG